VGLAAVAVFLVCAAAAAAAVPAAFIHAHRGGPYINGVPSFPENTLPGFAHSAAAGYTLEFDVKLTADKVPIVIHDDSLDRTTNCTGKVKNHTAADIAANCRADVLGVPGTLPSVPVASPTVPIPTLAQVLALAISTGARINLEIKNFPIDSDFDASDAFANRVMDGVLTSGIPQSKVIIQSFWPPNLSVAQRRWKGVQTSYLTQKELELLAPVVGLLYRVQWLSPAWPLTLPTTTLLARPLGQKLVPYTIDDPGSVQNAIQSGVDALITNDPPMASAAAAALP
jgi:glycerophosphoryl diester phosphodiesterase